MYAGELLTTERATFDKYLASNASWDDEPASRIAIEALREEEEEEEYFGVKPSFRSAVIDAETRFSTSFLSRNTFNGATPSKSPHAIPTAPSTPSRALSVSPAASFLSFFNNPTPDAPKPDDEGQVVAGYTLGSIIGYGSSSIIRRASSSSGAQAAVKIVRRSDLVKAGNAPQARRRLQHEADVWTSLSHEHILPLFSAVHTSYADYFFTLYCPAGSLFDILKRDGSPALPQDDAGTIFRQIVRGMRYLHEVARYVHRDMKLENVLVDEMGVCKIGDFGMSRKIGSVDEEDEEQEEQQDAFQGNSSIHRAQSLLVPSTRKHMKGTQLNHIINRHSTTRHRNSTSANEPNHVFQPGSLPYAAPELLLPQTSEALRPHPSQDIWALGIMLYALLTGRLPFRDSFEPRLQMKILNGTYEVPQGIGRGAERILQGCLDLSVTNRWTIAMVDEIAWGVGWGAEGDDATPTDPHENHQYHCESTSSRSRSHSRPGEISIPAGHGHDRQQDEPKSRSSMDATSRRSSSRAQRSLSRAPVPPGRSVSRSISRHPRGSSPTPHTPAEPFTPSIMSASSLLSSGPYSAFFGDSALDVSPSSSSPVQRGRRQNKFNHSNSRSPSPSVVPTTPIDGAFVASPTGFMEQPDELHLDPESSRGRSTIRSLEPDKMQMHNTGIGRQRVFGFEHEIGLWPSSQDIDHDMERVLSSNGSVPRSSDLAFVGEADTSNVGKAEPSWRQRPSSSPPTASRLQQKESLRPNHKTAMEPFLDSSAASSNTNLVLRSRSAVNGRR